MNRTLRWIMGLAVAYLVIRNVPDMARYIKISRV